MNTSPLLRLTTQFAHQWRRPGPGQAVPAAAVVGLARPRSRATSRYRGRRLVCFGVVLALGLASQAARAQTAPAPQPNPGPATATPEPRDTVAAIQQVFKSRRRTGTFLLAGSAGFVAAMAVSTAVEEKSFLGPDEVALLATIVTAPVWGWGIVKQARFSPRREQQVLADYQRLHTIPRFVRRRMRFAT